MKVKEDNSSS